VLAAHVTVEGFEAASVSQQLTPAGRATTLVGELEKVTDVVPLPQ
jgi:hypothetical protein